MRVVEAANPQLPGAALDPAKMPGHWLLARAGKRVLRPGGRVLTRKMLDGLDIASTDVVVELAPGLGVTARETLARRPDTYIGVERDKDAAAHLETWLAGPRREVRRGSAEQTGLAASSATVVYGEAMLTMQPPETKARIVREASRILAPGGRYAIHELCLQPDDLSPALRDEIVAALGQTIRVGARPLTVAEWRALLTAEGFVVQDELSAPMHLLEPRRLIEDEGLARACKVIINVLRDPVARPRALAMRRTFRRYRQHLGAVALIATRPVEATA